MKTTIQNIYTACNLDLSTINSEAIDILVEIIEANHSLSEPESFEFNENEPIENDYSDIDDYKNQYEFWENSYNDALQEYQEEMQSEYSELIDALNELNDKIRSGDFYFEYDGNEYRIIAESGIWDIYVEAIKNIVTDCYDLKLENIPDFVAWEIDWEQTAENAYVDGYGHTFSGYDGSELETKNYYIFRTN
jgi:hypothetical protein